MKDSLSQHPRIFRKSNAQISIYYPQQTITPDRQKKPTIIWKEYSVCRVSGFHNTAWQRKNKITNGNRWIITIFGEIQQQYYIDGIK